MSDKSPICVALVLRLTLLQTASKKKSQAFLSLQGVKGWVHMSGRPGALALVAALSPKAGYLGGQVPVLLFFVVIVDQTQQTFLLFSTKVTWLRRGRGWGGILPSPRSTMEVVPTSHVTLQGFRLVDARQWQGH